MIADLRPPPGLLAFDTATEQMAVAASGPRHAVAWNGPGGPQASATLLPRVRAVMAEAGLEPAALQAVAFGAGPGAFTGLRTACAAAQGLAAGWGLPVLPIDSLMLVAEDTPWRDGPVWVAMDARMDEIYAACYLPSEAGGTPAAAATGWQVLVPPALFAWPALAARWQAEPPRQVAGSALAAFAGRLPLGGARLQAEARDRASALLRCAAQAWAAGQARDPAEALPVYLRDKVALTTAERAAARPDGAADGRPAGAAA